MTPYDFRRPVKMSRENVRALQIAFETFARQASTVLTSSVRSVCEIEVVSIEQETYSEYVDSLDEMTYMTIFSIDPIQQHAVLDFPLAMTMSCVDRLLGGPGHGEQPERPLTDLESSVVDTLFERMVAEIRYAFSSLVPLEPKIVGVEYNPSLAQVGHASDAMVVAHFRLREGGAEHKVSVCVAFAGLLPFLSAGDSRAVLSPADRVRREEATSRLAAGFREVPIEVAIRFRATPADPVELSGLQVGDVVRLKHPAEAPLDVMAADVVFAHATPGSQGRRLAALVVATPTQEKA